MLVIIITISMVSLEQTSSDVMASSRYMQLGSGLIALQFISIIRAVGFGLIAVGAIRLKKIEEV